MTVYARAGDPVLTASTRRATAALVAAAAVVAIFGAGYRLGTARAGATELRGVAQVGDRVASITVDGTSYGVAGSIPWIDVNAASHERGWPDCLVAGTSAVAPVVSFGAVDVKYPDGTSVRQVVYVDCRS